MTQVKTSLVALALVAGLGIAGTANAYSVTHHSNVQQGRINRGTASGQLTPGESNSLQSRQHAISNTAAQERSANGGTLTRGEKAKLGARQAGLSARIAVQRHDGQSAPAAAPAAAAPPQ